MDAFFLFYSQSHKYDNGSSHADMLQKHNVWICIGHFKDNPSEESLLGSIVQFTQGT